ncbi:glycosyltransferase family 39 protein [Myxococcota bacterium]|nr:glycosyltransferase family 39 protein [Myxococcota bacterium]
MTGAPQASDRSAPLMLTGRPPAFKPLELALIGILFVAALVLRARGLAVEGFADDEVHKWLAANRYLTLDIIGDDIEHPMLMKWLIALCIVIGRAVGWEPEAIVRVPNVVAGALYVPVIALLGRRLFGSLAGVVAAGIVAFSPTAIGYHRISKEDTLLGLFLLLVLYFLGEAKAAADDHRARDQARSEWLAAASLGLMFASKYFFFLAPIPVVAYVWLSRSGTAWHVPIKRWLVLIAGAIVVFAAVNWTPFMPSSWAYGMSYMAEKHTVHGALPFMGKIYHNLPSYGLNGTPAWFYVVFAAVKLAPPTFVVALAGLFFAIRERHPSHVVVLSWLVVWFLILSVSGSKWGRFFTSVLPAFALLAGHAVDRGIAWIEAARARGVPSVAPWTATAAVALSMFILFGTEAAAALRHGPHYRLYVSVLGGGPANLDYYFPHCDYYDAGFREVMKEIAAKAEQRAEVSTEIQWPAKYYAETFGRKDFIHTFPREGEACKDSDVCYIVVQAGRRYFRNEEAHAYLADKAPWFVQKIDGHDAVKVYRLERGDMPYQSDRDAYAKAQTKKTAEPAAPDTDRDARPAAVQ